MKREATSSTLATGAPDATSSRRAPRWLWVLGVLALAGGVVVLISPGGRPSQASDAEGTATPRSTATVQRRDIVSTTSLSGTLTYAEARDVGAARGGTITWLPEVGTTIEPGHPLFAVNGEPVVLLPGQLPMWRDLSVDSDPGADVEVLERALIDLGVTDEANLTVDETFTWVTAAAVADLREQVGLPEGDSIAVGEVVYLPGVSRVAGVHLEVGDLVQPGEAVLTATATARIVKVDLDAADQGLVAEGDTVEVELPDGSSVAGTVALVSPVAEARTSTGQNATTTYVIPVEITLSSGGEAFDEAPVSITVASDVATDVLAVPVEALLALAEGGYALEVVQADGSTSLVAVTIGGFSDGWVAVEGADLSEGMEVVTA
ncbi:MAG TPA: HlyD family efflux transporter periplasmic adaptor subunit [Egibacteraceae bacterium]|nr:HlyD family efflux transporter periplasmic adaptor subunit [Egibacteraceae bacterium]